MPHNERLPSHRRLISPERGHHSRMCHISDAPVVIRIPIEGLGTNVLGFRNTNLSFNNEVVAQPPASRAPNLLVYQPMSYIVQTRPGITGAGGGTSKEALRRMKKKAKRDAVANAKKHYKKFRR